MVDVNETQTINRFAQIQANNGLVNSAGSVGAAKTPDAGFGQYDVAEMPAYVQSYTKRGGGYDAEVQPVYGQARFGNPRYRGGMGAYLSMLETDRFFDGYKQKKGNHGVFDQTRWAPGYDWRGGFGVASAASNKNFPGIQTRGGRLRAGAPKRADYVERPDYNVKLRPGIGTSRYSQAGGGDNYPGQYEYRRRTPVVQRANDMQMLRPMIEQNPFHISSHAAAQARASYTAEMGDYGVQGYKAYQDNLGDMHGKRARDTRTIGTPWHERAYLP